MSVRNSLEHDGIDVVLQTVTSEEGTLRLKGKSLKPQDPEKLAAVLAKVAQGGITAMKQKKFKGFSFTRITGKDLNWKFEVTVGGGRRGYIFGFEKDHRNT